MPTTLAAEPHFVLPLKEEHGGVHVLNLRQVNLHLITTCTPPLTNATNHIRPYSLLCSIYWKYYNLKTAQGSSQKPRICK